MVILTVVLLNIVILNLKNKENALLPGRNRRLT